MASVALAIPALAMGGTGGSSLTVGALAVYGLGAPVVHIAHGQGKHALADIPLRLLLPLVTGFGGAGIALATGGQGGGDECGGHGCNALAGGLVGAGVGMVAASIIDAAFLAYEPAPENHPKATEVLVRPSVSLAPEQGSGASGTVGLSGAF